MPNTSLRIGTLAAELAINPKTIRYYEQIGLLPKPRRTSSGYRLYAAADRDRLAFIAKAKSVGLTLDQIKQIIALRDTGICPCDHVLDLIDHKVTAIDAQMRALTALRHELLAIKAVKPQRSPEDSAICGIIEHVQPTRRSTKTSRATGSNS